MFVAAMTLAVSGVAKSSAVKQNGTLFLDEVRTLDCAGPSGPKFIAAASGLVRVADTYWVVADDELFMAAFKDGDKTGTALRVLDGELPTKHKERKAAKPDFEALAHVPAGVSGLTNDILLAFGSGSKPNRNRGVAVTIDKNAQAVGAVRVFDLTPLYAALAPKFAELNIEGATVVKNVLRLAQRGNGVGNTNALIDIDLKHVVSAVTNRHALSPSAIKSVTKLELGDKNGVAWSVTDITALSDGRILFAAAAEATNDAYNDGPVAAAGIGILSADGAVITFREVSPTVKLEGVHVLSEAPGKIELAAVCDGDDEKVAAKLFRARLSY